MKPLNSTFDSFCGLSKPIGPSNSSSKMQSSPERNNGQMRQCPFCFSDGRVQRMRGLAGASMFAFWSTELYNRLVSVVCWKVLLVGLCMFVFSGCANHDSRGVAEVHGSQKSLSAVDADSRDAEVLQALFLKLQKDPEFTFSSRED